MPDVISRNKKESWFYTDIVKDHFFNPRKFMRPDEEGIFQYNAMGLVGSPACGDAMKIWLQVDPVRGKSPSATAVVPEAQRTSNGIDADTETIKDCRWQTFGCASAIASTSMLATIITERGGMKLDDALKVRPQDIMERLGGLPSRKIHCSVLGDKALLSAINDYFRRTGQRRRIKAEGARVIDKVLKITDHDIEEAVLEGATTLEDVQKKTKAGAGDRSCVPEVEQLIRFYKEKYFGA